MLLDFNQGARLFLLESIGYGVESALILDPQYIENDKILTLQYLK